MSNVSDFVIEDGVLVNYTGPGGMIKIPDGVREIADSVFLNCWRLTEVIIPESVTSIGNNAFANCSNLIRVSLPDTLREIGTGVFSNCPKLTDCNIPESVEKWNHSKASYKEGVFFKDTERGREVLEVFAPGKKEFTIPSWVSRIRGLALRASPIEKLMIPAGVKLDENVFCNCDIELSGDYMAVREELPSYYIEYFENTVKTPEILAARILYQSGKQWNETLTIAAQDVDKAGIILAMMDIVEKSAEVKFAAKLAETVLDYLEELETDTLIAAYSVLRKGRFKALRKLVLDEGFQNKWLEKSENKSLSSAEKLVKEHWKTTDATKKLRTVINKGVRYRGSDHVCSPNVLIFIVSEYASQLEGHSDLPIGLYEVYYVQCHFSDIADRVAAELDPDELRSRLEELAYMGKNSNEGYVLALGRYGSGKQISHLCAKMREWANWGDHGITGRRNIIISRSALMLSDTREAMIALDKAGVLNGYAKMRNTEADVIRDTVLSDFGFDLDCSKKYNLGGNTIRVSMASNLTLQIYDTNAGKNVRTLPKKNADPALYEAAKADISDLKKNIRRVIKHRRDSIFDAFLSGEETDPVNWKKIYIGNPVLRAVAELVVWVQADHCFTISGTDTVDQDGKLFTVDDTTKIRVAHPIEMSMPEVKAWQDYYVQKNLKQPFEQVWEPVINPAEISADRYKGVVLPIYRFVNKDRHGIYSYGVEAYSEEYGLKLDDCELETEGSAERIIPGITDDATYTLGDFHLKKITRKSNHIIYMLDKWTILDHIEKDDINIAATLPGFTLAQLTEFIRFANEKKSSNCLAVLMDYKNKNYEKTDPFAEFTLD